MTDDKKSPRGESPRGNFEAAKVFATASEDERVAAARKKNEGIAQHGSIRRPTASLISPKSHLTIRRTEVTG
jgi:hypothetical protein